MAAKAMRLALLAFGHSGETPGNRAHCEM